MNRKKIRKLVSLLEEFLKNYDDTQIGFDSQRWISIDKIMNDIKDIEKEWIDYYWRDVNPKNLIVRMSRYFSDD